MRNLIAVLCSLALLSACGSSQADYEAEVASFRAGPTPAERQSYTKLGIIDLKPEVDNRTASQKLWGGGQAPSYRGFYVTVKQSVALPVGYFEVELRPTTERPVGIVSDYRIPDVILADVPQGLSQAAYDEMLEDRGTKQSLLLAKEVAKRTFCVGRKVVPSDKTGFRVDGTADLAKLSAAAGGDLNKLFTLNVKDLNVKTKPVPVIERVTHHRSSWPHVEARLKC